MRNDIIASKMMPTMSNWHSNYIHDDKSLVDIEVFTNDDKSLIIISAWGTDDFGIDIEFNNISYAIDFYNWICSWNYININDLLKLGFKEV